MKIIRILTFTLIIILILSTKVFALQEIISTADNFIETGRSHTETTMDSTKLMSGSEDVYNLLLTIGTMVAIIVGIFLGTKYIMSGIEEKAKVKESLIPYLISCVVLFGSVGIWKLMISILQNFK